MKRALVVLALLAAIAVGTGCTKDQLPAVDVPCLASCGVQAVSCAMQCSGKASAESAAYCTEVNP